MNTEPQNKLTLEWAKGSPDGHVALIFDTKTWNIFEIVADQQNQSAEDMIKRAVTETIDAMPADGTVLEQNGPYGRAALIFNAKTWTTIKDAANARDQFAEHIVTRAVVNCLGSILMDNMALNRFLRGSD
jgi:hypothetical protein